MNKIELAKLYHAGLDKVMKDESKTAILQANDAFYKPGATAKEVLLMKMDMSGLSDYDRESGGYPTGGSINAEWESHKLENDRGQKFILDSMDDLEAMKVPGANLLKEFMRTKVIPEVDSVRFATIAQKTKTEHVISGTITTSEEAYDAILTAQEALNDAEVTDYERILFISNRMQKLIKQSDKYIIGQGENPDMRFDEFDGMRVIKVPAARFNSKVELLNTDDTDSFGGFKPAADSKPIDFMIVQRRCALAIVKHQAPKIILAHENQHADGSIIAYRLYHGLIMEENKTTGAYVHLQA